MQCMFQQAQARGFIHLCCRIAYVPGNLPMESRLNVVRASATVFMVPAKPNIRVLQAPADIFMVKRIGCSGINITRALWVWLLFQHLEKLNNVTAILCRGMQKQGICTR